MRGVVWGGAMALAVSLCAPDANAQAASAPHTARPVFAAEAAAKARPLDPAERDARIFLKRADASSRFQIDAARIALARSPTAPVRSLARRLQDRHRAAGNDLLRMLHQRGLAAPMMENAQRRTLSRLARLPARRFDRAYLDAVLADLRANDQLCRRARGAVHDPALSNWIEERESALREQSDDAQRLLASAAPPPSSRPVRLSHRGRGTTVSRLSTR